MKHMNHSLIMLLMLVLCACLCLPLCTGAASGVETDEDGGVWDYGKGTYTAPDGHVYQITPDGVNESSGSGSVIQSDGSMLVVTGEKDSVQKKEDGSIEVKSGQIQGPQSDDPTRAPIEGDDWKALLASVAARNGSETPTVWIDPATGTSTAVDVVYMGVGRSMVMLNGQKTLVNTVDLKWQTEAPEDKVLAMVDAPKNGYTWLRKAPNSKITNPKIAQVRTNTVLRVVSTGKNWTMVDYDGLRGYVKSSSLEFFRNDHTDFEAGYLSVKGKTQGKDTVKIRSMDMSGKILKECRVGTPVTVFDVIEGWVELDGEGFHGVIQSKYVTMEKETASAD